MKNNNILATLFLGSLAISLTTCAGDLALNGVVLAPTNPGIPVGITQQFTATGYFNDQTIQDITTQVTWTSSNSSVAMVDGRGLATGFTPGTTTITATSSIKGSFSDANTASTTLTVTSAILSSISLTPANPGIPAGVAQQFSAIGTFSDGTSHDITAQVAWSSSNTSVATINSSGLAVALSAGSTSITATSGGISGSTTLTVNSETLSSIFVIPVNRTIPSVPSGIAQQFSAIGTFSDGTSHDITAQVVWSSVNTSVATVNSSGLATAFSAGSTSITATSGSVLGSATLTVSSATLSSIFVTPANPSIPIGGTRQFTATGTYSDGTSYDITGQIAWSSSNTSVATVNSSGLATAFSAGTTSITATSGIIFGSTTLTVPSG